PVPDDAADWLAAQDAREAREKALDSPEWVGRHGRIQRDSAGRVAGQFGYDPETGGEIIRDASGIPRGWFGHQPAARPPRRPPPRHHRPPDRFRRHERR
ncbi:MAG TPA: hypothetical protein VM597_00095, partial [Gemmataceae bacterium]|nr:hypothetical protein [Gemmataceae bacterium]